MKFTTTTTLLAIAAAPAAINAFMPSGTTTTSKYSFGLRMGYLDDLNKYMGSPEDEEPEVDDSREATKLAGDKVDRGGVGDWSQFVDFDEFDGGDGQMGVAGDGNKQLEKFDMSSMAKSKEMSAKNAWGKTTGYAEDLKAQGMEAQRAQQLENWKNQQEVLTARKQQRYMTDSFDKPTGEDDQWSLASFGIERNTDFDMDQEWGVATKGDTIEGVIDMKARMGQADAFEFTVKVCSSLFWCCEKTSHLYLLLFSLNIFFTTILCVE